MMICDDLICHNSYIILLLLSANAHPAVYQIVCLTLSDPHSMSNVKNLKRIGERTEPWGKPYSKHPRTRPI